MMHHIYNIWLKEIMDSARDKRGLRQALLVPVVLGVMYAVMNPLLASAARDQAADPLTIPTIGLENVPDSLHTFLAEFDITLEGYDGDLAADIEKGDVTAGLIVPADFAASLASEEPVAVTILFNPDLWGHLWRLLQ